ncbi:hypothetical protein J6590_043241 [Homalodisca vitripennis]|nr:hypothetical protein J6590_043241 [Homalodisca vitripennis]
MWMVGNNFHWRADYCEYTIVLEYRNRTRDLSVREPQPYLYDSVKSNILRFPVESHITIATYDL